MLPLFIGLAAGILAASVTAHIRYRTWKSDQEWDSVR